MKHSIRYSFKAKMWQNAMPSGWFFVSLPKKMSSEIRKNFKNQEEGWGRMKVFAITKELEWKTSIWFDTKAGIYILPIKSEIRKKGNIKIDDTLEISVLL